jgi:nucleoside-diphosphate-sugar epimerase
MHMSTAIPRDLQPRCLAAQFEGTQRLRDQGTSNLIAAADDLGVQRFITQSIAFGYDPTGGGLANEQDPLWTAPSKLFAPSLVGQLQREGQHRGLASRA